MDVMSELREMGPSIRANDYRSVLEKIHELWDRIPEPKVNMPNAYLVLEYGVACSIKLGDFNEAQKWAASAPDFTRVRQDMGEVEFLIGKVAFVRGELEVARTNFAVANAKSEGRIFEGEDDRYKELIK